MEKEQIPPHKDPPKKSLLTSFIVTGVGLFSLFALAMPSAVPDFIPVIGALDEAVATGLLISCLAYFGVDIGAVFGRGKFGKKKQETESEVIDAEVEEQR